MSVYRASVKENKVRLIECAEAVGEFGKYSGLYECSYNPIDPFRPPPLLLSFVLSPSPKCDPVDAVGVG